MKKFAFALVGASILVAPASAAIVYDTIAGTGSTTTTGGTPRFRMSDEMSFLDPGAGFHWNVNSVTFNLFINGAQTFAATTAEVILWNEWNGAGFGGAGTNVYQNEAGRETFNMGPITTTGSSVAPVTATFATPIAMANFANVGIEIYLRADGADNSNLALGLKDIVPAVGTSNNLFYRDANANGIIETTDGRTITGWTNSNTALTVDATAVPEPGSMIALTIGALGLVARRRRAK